jgi:hypothetical protein
MKKVIKRIFLGVFALMIFALGAGIISSYYFLEVSDYEFENEKIQESVKLVQLSDICISFAELSTCRNSWFHLFKVRK